MLIKRVIIKVFIFISWASPGQYIVDGKFSPLAVGQENYKFYEFNRNGMFQFHSGASLGDDFYGNGSFKVVGDTLVLAYTTDPKERAFHTSQTFINDEDSILLDIEVYNLNKEKISGVNIIWEEDNKKGYKGAILGEPKNEISIRKLADSLRIVLSHTGYENYHFLINRRYNYKIRAYLQAQGIGSPIKNQTEKFLIRKEENGELILEDVNGQKWIKID